MATKRKKRIQDLAVLHPDAAGSDVGASEIFVAVPADRDAESVRSFATFTRDLHVLADWLQACGIRSAAMESTSVYWIPLHQILEARGIQVYLVNAPHVKNVPGRKTDVSLSVDSVSPLGRPAASQLSAAGGDLRHSVTLETSG
jgi:transposase